MVVLLTVDGRGGNAVIDVPLFTVTLLLATEPNKTLAPVKKPVPVIVTLVRGAFRLSTKGKIDVILGNAL